MPRVAPSDVVDFIDTTLRDFREPGSNQSLGRQHSPLAAGLVALVDAIPDHLLTLTTTEFSEYVCSVEAIRDALKKWQSQQNEFADTSLGVIFPRRHPVTVIRQALAKCHDQGPTSTTTELAFIPDKDAELRANLRTDMSAVDLALSNAEWKAATVLGGAVIEALLLWALRQKPPAEIAAVAPNLPKALEDHRWKLSYYIDAAHSLKIITDSTASQARLAKDFRNLIHPGAELRLGQKCDRGTALSAAAGIEHVVRDLTP
jgi:hypothetical protein